jgi:hypothetical protein
MAGSQPGLADLGPRSKAGYDTLTNHGPWWALPAPAVSGTVHHPLLVMTTCSLDDYLYDFLESRLGPTVISQIES